MLTLNRFRILLISSIAFGLIAATIDFVIPNLLPLAYKKFQASENAALSTPWILGSLALGLVTLVALFSSVYGLFRLRPWGLRWALISTALSLILICCERAFAQSGVATAFSYVSSYLWGAVLWIAYIKPDSLFKKSEVEASNIWDLSNSPSGR